MISFVLQNARWLGAGGLLAFGSSFGQTWFISLFAGEIREAHGLSDGGWGAIYTVATLGSAALLLFRGGLADTIRLSRLAPAVAGLFALAALIMATSASIASLVLAVFLLRFCGQGMFTHMSVTALARWFHATRGRAIALAGLCYSLGEAVLPLPTVLLVAWIGWRWTWSVVALVIVLAIVPLLVWLLAQDRAPEGEAEAQSGTGIGGRHWTRSEALKHWLFPAMVPFLFTPGFVGTVMFFHQVHTSEVKGWTLTQMAPGYAVWALVTVVSSLIAGWAVDRFGAERLMPIALVPMGLGVALLGPAQSVWVWFVILAIMAVSHGINMSLTGALLPRLYGTRNLGAIRAMQVAIMVLSSAVGPGVTGLLIDAGIPFPAQGLALGLWCLVISALMVWIVIRLRPELPAMQQAT